MYDYSKLIGLIVEKYGTRDAFAKSIGWTKSKLSSRLTCTTHFKQDEIDMICSTLGIPASKIGSFFYTKKVAILATV
jgi:hypothetical protein